MRAGPWSGVRCFSVKPVPCRGSDSPDHSLGAGDADAHGFREVVLSGPWWAGPGRALLMALGEVQISRPLLGL